MRYVARRLVRLVLVLGAVVALSFAFLHAIPGDPVAIRIGEHATPAEVVRARQRLGMNLPVAEQFLRYLGEVARGDLGRSLADDEPVATKLARAFPATLELGTAAMVWAMLVGLPLGLLAAARPRGFAARLAGLVSIGGVSVPVFWLGWILIYLFAALPAQAGLPHLPIAGRTSLAFEIPPRTRLAVLDALLAGDGGAVFDALEHLLLPAIALGTIPLAIVAKVTRVAVAETLAADYVRTARAKGAGPLHVLLGHALRSALVPILTVLGLQVGLLLSGAVLTEQVFGWPGIGRLVFDAVAARDFPVVNGCVVLFATIFVVVGTLVDLSYAALDPRILRAPAPNSG